MEMEFFLNECPDIPKIGISKPKNCTNHAVHNVVLTFLGANDFVNNSAIYNGGGAVYTSYDVVLSFNGTNNFVNNSAINNHGGAAYTSYNVVLTFNGTSSFINNSAVSSCGGVIYTVVNVVLIYLQWNQQFHQ